MIGPLTVREVIDALAPDVRLTPEAGDRAREGLRSLSAGTPWYLRALMGFGAWVGTWFLLAFVAALLALVLGSEVDGAAVIVGVGLVALAVALRRNATSDFLCQLALVVSLTGQGMLVGGIGSASSSLVAASIAGLLVSVLLLAIFPDRVHRFLSTVAVTTALLGLIYEWHIPHGAEAVALILIAVVLTLWRAAPIGWRSGHAELVHPIVSGAVVSLFGLLLLAAILPVVELSPPRMMAQQVPTTAGAVLGLLWLVWEVFAERRADGGTSELLGVTVAIVLLAAITWRTPAFATTLLVMVLAFDRRSRPIMALSVLCFVTFGALYYYNLELTLLQKSAILVGSGLLRLAGCGIMRWRVVREGA